MQPSKRSISLITYNIHKGFGVGAVRFLLPQMRLALTELNPDFVFLQEVQGQHKRREKRINSWPELPQFEYIAENKTESEIKNLYKVQTAIANSLDKKELEYYVNEQKKLTDQEIKDMIDKEVKMSSLQTEEYIKKIKEPYSRSRWRVIIYYRFGRSIRMDTAFTVYYHC
jgi:hypothetical protein